MFKVEVNKITTKTPPPPCHVIKKAEMPKWKESPVPALCNFNVTVINVHIFVTVALNYNRQKAMMFHSLMN